MKLQGNDARTYLARPDPARAGLLIFGADTMRVALKRQDAVRSLIGPAGEAEMRLQRIAAADLRKDGTLLLDALKSISFFPGPRAVLVEDATDGLTASIQAALQDWQSGDATLVITAGNLTGKSMLKTLIEKHPSAVSVGLYDDPPTQAEIEAELKRAGLAQLSGPALAELGLLATALDPGDFRQTLEKVALYKIGDATPLTVEEIQALAPATIEAEVDDLSKAVADRSSIAVGGLVRRLEGQGVAPVTICIAVLRHFRTLHLVAADPGGPAVGIMKARVFGARRDQVQRQASQWGMRPLELALAELVETDLTLRSTSRAPAMAVMERALIRITRMKGDR